MVNNLDYVGVKFPVPKKDFGKIEKKNENKSTFANIDYNVLVAKKFL